MSSQGTASCSWQAVPADTLVISCAALGNVLRKTEMSYVEKVTSIPLPHKKVRPRSHSSREDSQSSVALTDEKENHAAISENSSFPFLRILSKHRQHVPLGSLTIFVA